MRGEMVEQGLQLAADVANAKVAWLHPDRPVLPALFNQTRKKDGFGFKHFDANCHALRLGAAQDIAHLPSAKDGAGFVSNEARQSLGHRVLTTLPLLSARVSIRLTCNT